MKVKVKLPTVFRLKGCILCKIWKQMLLVLAHTGVVCYIHNYVDGMTMDFPQTLIPVLAVVTALLLIFRTNSAYDRYWEGRKLWSNLTVAIRTLTRCVWINVEESKEDQPSKDFIEKITFINLILGFAIATKNYLRGRDSSDDENLSHLIKHLPKFGPSYHGQLNYGKSTYSLLTLNTAARFEKNKTMIVPMGISPSSVKFSPAKVNLPIQLTYHIGAYIKMIKNSQRADPNTLMAMNTALGSLVDSLTNLERILTTPIPGPYSIFLQQAVWIYILALPFQLVNSLNWFTIPAVAVAAFALLGILGIGMAIENPFQENAYSLALDDICQTIRNETEGVIGYKNTISPEQWMFSQVNHPLAPESYLAASQLATMSLEDIQSIIDESSSSPGPPSREHSESPERVLPTKAATYDSANDSLLKR